MKEAASIGIIGGADGPTAIFITGDPLPLILAAAALVIAVIALIHRFRKR